MIVIICMCKIVIGYLIFLIMVFVLIMVFCYYIFVFKIFMRDDLQMQVFCEVSFDMQVNSLIKNDCSIIEVMFYGCYYCVVNEENFVEFSCILLLDSIFIFIYIVDEDNGFVVYVLFFVMLEVMGIEKQICDSVYNVIIMCNVDLMDEKKLNGWLVKNNIDVVKFNMFRLSKVVKECFSEMVVIIVYYDINVILMFIINKCYVVVQDCEFLVFVQCIWELFEEDK